MIPLITRLLSSVRLAATAGHAPGELVAAFEDGGWAARHGHRLPPFVILDVRATLNDLAAGRPLSLPQRHDTGLRCSAAERYDDWLSTFAKRLAGRLGRGPLSAVAATATENNWAVGPHLPPLLAAWPDLDDPNHFPRDWEDAYRFLAVDPDAVADGLNHWAGNRDTRLSSWKPWPEPSADLPPEPLLWARFAADVPGDTLHQRFDHAAAELYLRAPDPPSRSAFDARLEDERDTLSPLDRPVAESVEEQHPFVGAPTVYTYTLGEYGLFKLVNRTDPRLSTPPRASRPQPFEIHLAWAVGYRGLRTAAGRPRDGAAGGDRVADTTAQASVLQGVVALLLDDWRAALAKHRLTFHLHRFGAAADEWKPRPGSPLRALLPGKRWKAELLGTAADRGRPDTDIGTTLPPGVIGLLFRRPSLAEAGKPAWRFGGRGEPVPDARKWWCGVMLREELERDLGFDTEGELTRTDSPFACPLWTGPPGALPRVLRHLVVVDPPRRTGWVCAVDFAAGRIGLRPARTGRTDPPTDDAFAELRQNAWGVVADVLFELAPV